MDEKYPVLDYLRQKHRLAKEDIDNMKSLLSHEQVCVLSGLILIDEGRDPEMFICMSGYFTKTSRISNSDKSSTFRKGVCTYFAGGTKEPTQPWIVHRVSILLSYVDSPGYRLNHRNFIFCTYAPSTCT